MHPQVHKSSARPTGLNEAVELLRADITDPASWDRLLSGTHPDVVIHLAAETGTGQSLTAATRHAHVNVTGTTVMLDALARHERIPARILLCSSRAVYGDGAWIDDRIGEISYPRTRSRDQLARKDWDYVGMRALPSCSSTTRALPASIYGATKLAQEHILYAWAAAFGTLPVIMRLQNVYGPGQSLSNPYTGIVSLFCRTSRAGKSVPLYEDGKMLRDFVLIDDVISAIGAALDVKEGSPHPYDVGTGLASSIEAIAVSIAKLYGAPPPHVCELYRYGDVRHAACLIDETKEGLGWQPEFPVSTGLQRLKEWIETQFVQEEGVPGLDQR
jgi:dTDP-L-rhamnose 4-epimerase